MKKYFRIGLILFMLVLLIHIIACFWWSVLCTDEKVFESKVVIHSLFQNKGFSFLEHWIPSADLASGQSNFYQESHA
jgi:hypothetical protein